MQSHGLGASNSLLWLRRVYGEAHRESNEQKVTVGANSRAALTGSARFVRLQPLDARLKVGVIALEAANASVEIRVRELDHCLCFRETSVHFVFVRLTLQLD